MELFRAVIGLPFVIVAHILVAASMVLDLIASAFGETGCWIAGKDPISW